MKLAIAVAQHRRQTTRLSHFLSFLPMIPSPSFPWKQLFCPSTASCHICLWVPSSQAQGIHGVPLTLPATGHHQTLIAAHCHQELGELWRCLLVFFCATSVEDFKALILKASREPFLLLRHLSRAVASNRRRIKEGLSGLELSPCCCQCPSREEAQRIWEVKTWGGYLSSPLECVFFLIVVKTFNMRSILLTKF